MYNNPGAALLFRVKGNTLFGSASVRVPLLSALHSSSRSNSKAAAHAWRSVGAEQELVHSERTLRELLVEGRDGEGLASRTISAIAAAIDAPQGGSWCARACMCARAV